MWLAPPRANHWKPSKGTGKGNSGKAAKRKRGGRAGPRPGAVAGKYAKKKAMAPPATTGATGKKKKAKGGGVMDDLFGGLAQKKQVRKDAAAKVKAAAKAKKAMEKRAAKEARAQRGGGAGAGGPDRFDDDGLPIYSTASLGIGQGGGTPDCPFDCTCCF